MNEVATILAAFARAYPTADPAEIRVLLGVDDETARVTRDLLARHDRLRARARQLRAAA